MKELLSEAGQWYEKALKLDKNHVGSYQGFGSIHAFNSNYKEAFNSFKTKVLLVPWPNQQAIMMRPKLCRIVLEAKPKSGEDVGQCHLHAFSYQIMS